MKQQTKQERLAQEILTCRLALKAEPEKYSLYVRLGDALTRSNKLDEAILCYQTAIYKKTLKLYPELAQNSWNFGSGKKPEFMIIGAAKSGTTSLYNYITDHPLVLPNLKKEVNFWSYNFDKGLDWYLAHFPVIPKDLNFRHCQIRDVDA